MKTSKEIYKTLRDARMDAIDSIIEIMESKGVSEIDFEPDCKGSSPVDEVYDECEVWDSRIPAECYGKHGDEAGYLSKVILKDGVLEHTAIGFESGHKYSYGYIEDNAFIWAAALEWVESNLN